MIFHTLTKCGKIFPYKFADIEDVDYIVSDGKLPSEFVERAQAAEVIVL